MRFGFEEKGRIQRVCEDAEARGSAFESWGDYSGEFKKSMSSDDAFTEFQQYVKL